MNDTEPPPPPRPRVVDYASPAPRRRRETRYPIAIGLVMLALTLLAMAQIVVGLFTVDIVPRSVWEIIAAGTATTFATLGLLSRDKPRLFLGAVLLFVAAGTSVDASIRFDQRVRWIDFHSPLASAMYYEEVTPRGQERGTVRFLEMISLGAAASATFVALYAISSAVMTSPRNSDDAEA